MDKRVYEYRVVIEDRVIGTFRTLGDALLFLKACDYEYYDDPIWKYTIERVEI